jgi:glucose/arabinose dehydrogenase
LALRSDIPDCPFIKLKKKLSLKITGMSKLSIFSLPLLLLLLGKMCAPVGKKDGNILLDKIKLPPGFKIETYFDGISNARSMVMGSKGTLFVGTRSKGNVYALSGGNGNGKPSKLHIIASGLNMPNGVAFRNGSLYVAEVSRILRYDSIEQRLDNPPDPVVVSSSFPDDEHHGWKYIAFGPDGKLYVPVGAPCNICESSNEIYASIARMDADGSNLEVYAKGIRNTVGFDWHPDTRELWFTDNGRDWSGDDIPPDELNHAPVKGMHFGYPYCHGGDLLDTEFGKKHSCTEFTSPAMKLGPHVAALGMKFYTGGMFPAEYRKQVFIAEHGSWNRTNPIGYRISLVEMADGKATSYKVFAEGWLDGGQAWGRPVALLQLDDGSLLVSDDHAGAIYRIYYSQ